MISLEASAVVNVSNVVPIIRVCKLVVVQYVPKLYPLPFLFGRKLGAKFRDLLRALVSFDPFAALFPNLDKAL